MNHILRAALCCLIVFSSSNVFSQICFDGAYCPFPGDPIGNCDDPTITDEWFPAQNVLDPGVDSGAGGTCDILELYLAEQDGFIYMGIIQANQGTAYYEFYFNTDCDNSSGDSNFNGAEVFFSFRVQQDNVTNNTVWLFDGANWNTTAGNSSLGLAGFTNGCNGDNEAFLELQIPLGDLIDPCDPSGCGLFQLSFVQTYAGGNSNSQECDQIIDPNIDIIINQPPIANYTIDPNPACLGNPIFFDGTGSTGGDPLFFEWDINYDGSTFDVDYTDPSFSHTYLTPGVYTIALQLSDSNGCIDNSLVVNTQTVEIFASPVIDGNVTAVASCGDEIVYDASGSIDGSGADNLIYLWDFGDGNTSSDISGTYTYTVCPSGQITLTITDPDITNPVCQTLTLSFDPPVDNEPPTIICPQNLTIGCNDPIPLYTDMTAFANAGGVIMDNCGISLFESEVISTTPGICPIIESVEVMYSVTDLCGSVASCVQTITIENNITPTIICPPDITLECPADIDTSVTGSPIIVDICGDGVISYDLQSISFSGNCVNGVLASEVRTFTVTDDCGNVATCTQNITITDTTPPNAVCVDITVDVMGELTFSITDPMLIGSNSTDGCDPNLYIILDQINFSCADWACNDTIQEVTLTVEDHCGNIDSCSANITFLNTPQIDIICPADITINLNPTECGAYVAFDPPAVDNPCGGDYTITQVDTTGLVSGDYFYIGTTTLTYVALNIYGDKDTCNLNINVVPYDAPGYLICNNLINLSVDPSCGATITPDMILEGDSYSCYDLYEVIVCESINGPEIPTSPMVDEQYIGDSLYVKVCDPETGICCWGIIFIEDKLPPQISCSIDTIGCADSIDPFLIGFPTNAQIVEQLSDTEFTVMGLDSCGLANLNYEDVRIDQECSSEWLAIITRTWTADDGFATSSCDQLIFIDRPGIEDIVLPNDYDDIDLPAFDCTSPCVLADGTIDPTCSGEPGGTNCMNFILYYDDLEIPVCGNGYGIVREWTILDWCTGETIIHKQILKVFGSKPEISIHTDTLKISTDVWGCTGSSILPIPDIYYDCTPPDDASYYIIGDGNFLLSLANGEYTIDEAPLGESILSYIADDGCGKKDTTEFVLVVEDQIRPTPICDHHTVVSLNPFGEAKMYAETVDDGSYDNCELDKVLIKRNDLKDCGDGIDNSNFGPFISFCCDDAETTVYATLRVYDTHGNFNDCEVMIEVQDKILPTVVCAPNETFSCGEIDSSEIYNINSTVLKNPYVIENCGYTIELEVQDLSQCGKSVIQSNGSYDPAFIRTFIVTDSQGNTQNCSQSIYIIDTEPFSEDDITWPLDYEVGCMESVDPEDLPANSSYPVWEENICSMIAVTFDDQLFAYVDGVCAKILRTWTIIDWCVFEQDNPFTGGIWYYTQVIKVSNSSAPVFEVCSDITVSTSEDCNGFVSLIGIAIDDCDPDNISYTWSIDAYNDGSIDFTGINNDASGMYPIGTHKIIFTASDQCGNESMCMYLFTITDNKKPTPVCLNGLSTVIMPSAGEVTIWASDFNASSFDDCTSQENLLYSFSSDINDTGFTISCDDIINGISQIFTVKIYVTDESGNQDFCETTIFVNDNDDVCPDNASQGFANFAGSVEMEDGTPISGAVIYLTSQFNGFITRTFTTGVNGDFAFANVPMFFDYNLSPYRDYDYTEGVTTLDLVMIQKHLLGIENISNPYQLIAADANSSNTVTTIDIVNLRALILGIIDDLPQNYSWRFISNQSEFNNPHIPFPFQETNFFPLLDASHMTNYFTGVKVGDVNRSIQNQFIELEDRSTKEIIMPNLTLERGKTEWIPVYINNSNEFAGIQFSWSINDLEILDIRSGLLNISTSNFNLNDPQQMHFSWNDLNVDLDSKEPIFFIKAKSSRNAALKSMIKVSNSRLQSEVYTADLDVFDLDLVFEMKDQIIEIEKFSNTLYQNEPNPFTTYTIIPYMLEKDSDVILNIYDSKGITVLSKNAHSQKGLNQFILYSNEFEGSGLFYYEIESENFQASKKFIKN